MSGTEESAYDLKCLRMDSILRTNREIDLWILLDQIKFEL